MTKSYMKALGSLYGDLIEDPATIALPSTRSFAKSQKKRLPRVKRKNIEGGIQQKLVAWLKNNDMPVLSIPNEGDRGAIATHRLKQQGLWPGASDLFLARPTQTYPGYWIELKTPGEKPRPNQVAFMLRMRQEGYCVDWFDSLGDAQQSILNYLEGNRIDVKQL